MAGQAWRFPPMSCLPEGHSEPASLSASVSKFLSFLSVLTVPASALPYHPPSLPHFLPSLSSFLYQKCKSPYLLSSPLCWPCQEDCNPLFLARGSCCTFLTTRQEWLGSGWWGRTMRMGEEQRHAVRAERGKKSGEWRDLVPSESCRCESKASL